MVSFASNGGIELVLGMVALAVCKVRTLVQNGYYHCDELKMKN